MKIIIETIPLEKQRYPTLGDYRYLEDGTLHITISETGNDFYNKVVAVHELAEEAMTKSNGISEPDILKFDLEFEERIKKGFVHEDAEPGAAIDCPYKTEHCDAEIIERIMMNNVGISFEKYDNDIKTMFKNEQ